MTRGKKYCRVCIGPVTGSVLEQCVSLLLGFAVELREGLGFTQVRTVQLPDAPETLQHCIWEEGGGREKQL